MRRPSFSHGEATSSPLHKDWWAERTSEGRPRGWVWGSFLPPRGELQAPPVAEKGGALPNGLELRSVSTTNTYAELKATLQVWKDSSFPVNRDRGCRRGSTRGAETRDTNTVPGKEALRRSQTRQARCGESGRQRCCGYSEQQVRLCTQNWDRVTTKGWE